MKTNVKVTKMHACISRQRSRKNRFYLNDILISYPYLHLLIWLLDLVLHLASLRCVIMWHFSLHVHILGMLCFPSFLINVIFLPLATAWNVACWNWILAEKGKSSLSFQVCLCLVLIFLEEYIASFVWNDDACSK